MAANSIHGAPPPMPPPPPPPRPSVLAPASTPTPTPVPALAGAPPAVHLDLPPEPVSDHASPVSDHASPVSDHASPVSDHASPVSDHASPVSDHASPASDHASPASDHASPASDHASPARAPAHASPAAPALAPDPAAAAPDGAPAEPSAATPPTGPGAVSPAPAEPADLPHDATTATSAVLADGSAAAAEEEAAEAAVAEAAHVQAQLASRMKSRVILPDWVVHLVSATGQTAGAVEDIGEGRKKKGTIYSVAAHPDGTRVATAGIDSQIKMWNTDAILDPEWDRRREEIRARDEAGAIRREAVKQEKRERRMVKLNAFYAARQDALEQAKVAAVAAHEAPPLHPPSPQPVFERDPEDDTDDEEPLKPVKLSTLRNQTRLLGVLSRHTGSVMVVRWSNSGRYLASGSDDQVVLIWELDPLTTVPPPPNADPEKTYVNPTPDRHSKDWEGRLENWRPVQRLSGHTSDVTDLAWSPEDTFLATVGLDSTIVLWNGLTFERLKRVDPGAGFVKGVCFDPVGQYLAATSDDKAIRVWSITTALAPAHDAGSTSQKATMQVGQARHTVEMRLVKEITEPFSRSPGNLFFIRPSWSPDGSFLVAPNSTSATVSKGVGRGRSATKSGGRVFTAQIIERENWDTTYSFVGHENSTNTCAYSPRVFKSLDKDQPIATLAAVGSLDQSVSIWMSGLSRPVLVAKEVFERSVLDLSWTTGSKNGTSAQDGMTLYACSADGSLAAFVLEPTEVAMPLPDSELQSAQKRWGFRRSILGLSVGAAPPSNPGAVGTVAQPNQLKPRKKAPKAAPSPVGMVVPPTVESAMHAIPALPVPAQQPLAAQPPTAQPQIPYAPIDDSYTSVLPGSEPAPDAHPHGQKRAAQPTTEDVLRAQKRMARSDPRVYPQQNAHGAEANSVARALARSAGAALPPPPPPAPRSRPLLPPHGRKNFNRYTSKPVDRWPGNFDTQNTVWDDELLTANYSDAYDPTTALRWRLVGSNVDANPDPEALGEEAAAGLSTLALQFFQRRTEIQDGELWHPAQSVWQDFFAPHKSIVSCALCPPLAEMEGGAKGVAAVAMLDGTLAVYQYVPLGLPRVSVERAHAFRTVAMASILRLRLRSVEGKQVASLLMLDNDGNVYLWPDVTAPTPLVGGLLSTCRSLVGDPEEVALFTLSATGVVLLMRRSTGETFYLASCAGTGSRMEPTWEQVVDTWSYRWSDAWDHPWEAPGHSARPSINGSTAPDTLQLEDVPSDVEEDADEEVAHGLLSHPVRYLEERATPFLMQWMCRTLTRGGHHASAAARAARARRRDADVSVPQADPEADARKATVRRAATRAHWETRRAAALALQSAGEYVSATLGLARTLAQYMGEAPEELDSLSAAALALMDSLMGPVYSDPYSGAQKKWDPYVLGVRKRQLLQSVVQVLLACSDTQVVEKATAYQNILSFVPCN